MTIAANGRNHLIIRGALQAAQRAHAAIIIEIARSEGGANAYCPVNYWNIARQVDALCNELAITVPVAIHADHYGIKKAEDVPVAAVDPLTLSVRVLPERRNARWVQHSVLSPRALIGVETLVPAQ